MAANFDYETLEALLGKISCSDSKIKTSANLILFLVYLDR